MEVSGMVRSDQSEVHNTVKTLNNDYVRSTELLQQQERQKHKQTIFKRRRYAMYLIIAAIICFGLVEFLFGQRERLAEKESELLAAQQALDKANEQQEMLELQISKLEDDEYIAKLARKDYFLSEEGEIIFTIPEKETDEKKD